MIEIAWGGCQVIKLAMSDRGGIDQGRVDGAIERGELGQTIARLRRRYPARSRSRLLWRRYGWPLLLVGAALAVQIGVPPRPAGLTLKVVPFYVAVLFAGGLGGRRAAVIAAVLAASVVTGAYGWQASDPLGAESLAWLAVYQGWFVVMIFFAIRWRSVRRASG
jgi:hypothetical protein